MSGRSRARLLFVPIATLLLGLAGCASGDDPDVRHGDLSYPIAEDISPPLTEMVKAVPYQDPDEADLRVREAEPARPIPHKVPFTHQDDPVQQNFIGSANIPATTVNFEGQGVGLAGSTVNSAPPDTDGDIGPNHYVQIVNSQVTVFSRTGQKLLGPVNTNTFWNGFTGACATTNDGDGTMRYDRIANRWVIMQFSVNGGNGPFFQCIAVSTTADPTGTYARYMFAYNAFNDYPKTALWPDAYYVTFNMFPNNTFGGGKVCALDRAKMILGQTATMQCFDTGTNFGGLLASDLDGATPPPAGSPNYVLSLGVSNNDLAFWKLHVDFATPGNSTFTGPTTITVPTYTAMGSAKQPAGGSSLDALSDRLMNRFAYRNFGDHEALVANHSVVAGTGGGIRWYEIRTPGTTPTVFQTGTYAPDSSFRWMGSIAMDKAGNIALGFSTSSSTINPSIRYTARTATDAAGTMGQGEATIVNGTGVQNGGLTRWGDYSSLNIDPVDDCTFWYTGEYMGASGSFNWHTRVGSFKLANCGNTTTNDFTISVSPSSQTVAAGASTTYTVNTAVLSGTAETINLSISGLPTGATASFSPSSVSAGGMSTLTVNTASTTAAGSSNLTITGTAASATHSASATLVVTNNNNPPTVAITSPTNNAIVSGSVAVAATASDSDGTVASVRFDLPDGTSVTDTTAPYTTTWSSTTVTDGAGYTIKATATDDKGATSVSSVNVSVQNGTPTCINNTFTSTDVPKSIPDNNATGVTSNLSVTGNGNVGSLALSLHITHTFRGDLVVTLISPGGNSFVVSNRAGGSADNLVITNQNITTFNGQAAAGTWKLKVQDLASIDVGTIDSWSLNIVGDCNPVVHWSGSASPNIATKDNTAVCTSLTVTTTGGNSSVAKLDIAGRHDFRSILRGTLAHNGVTVTAFPTGTFPSGAGNFSFTNRSVPGLSGDSSGTWTFCIIDTDGFGDTGVLNTWSVHD